MAAEDKGDLGRAEAILVELHGRHPGIFAVDESLGLLYVMREKLADALPLLVAATREQPESDVAHANLGAAWFKLHQNEKALAEFERAAQLNPKNAETQQALGQLWMEAHTPDRAAKAFAVALAGKPGDRDLMLNLAAAMEEAGEVSKAREVLLAYPDVERSASAQSLLGDLDEKAGDFKQAAGHYARAVELDPTEPNAWTLGVEFLRHWTFDAAIREFESAAAKFPESTRIKLALGAAYFGNTDYAKAVPVFADLLGADASNPLYAELLGLSCTAVMQEINPRCTALVDYALAHPSDAKAATYAAATLAGGEQTEEHAQLTGKLLKNAIAADPKLPEAQFQMAVLMQSQSNWQGSIPLLEKAVALKPDFSQAHYRLALAYWRSGRKQDGQAEMQLQQKYSRQQQQDLDHRLRQITTFLVDVHN